jgi:hypothetical protein
MFEAVGDGGDGGRWVKELVRRRNRGYTWVVEDFYE